MQDLVRLRQEKQQRTKKTYLAFLNLIRLSISVIRMHRMTRGQRREVGIGRLLAAAHQRLENMGDVVCRRLRVNP